MCHLNATRLLAVGESPDKESDNERILAFRQLWKCFFDEKPTRCHRTHAVFPAISRPVLVLLDVSRRGFTRLGFLGKQQADLRYSPFIGFPILLARHSEGPRPVSPHPPVVEHVAIVTTSVCRTP